MLANIKKQSYYSHACGGCYGIFKVIPGSGGYEKDLQEVKFKSDKYNIRFLRFEHEEKPLKTYESGDIKAWFCDRCYPGVRKYMAQLAIAATDEIPEGVKEFEIDVDGVACIFTMEPIEEEAE